MEAGKDTLTDFRLEKLEQTAQDHDKQFDKLIEIHQELSKTLIAMQSTLEHNTIVLEEHQRRSIASENRLDRLEKSEQKHYGFIKGSIWAITIVWTVVLAGVAIYLKAG